MCAFLLGAGHRHALATTFHITHVCLGLRDLAFLYEVADEVLHDVLME
jgi:hypothetical protein